MSGDILSRFVAGEVGVYEALESDCPAGDPRRSFKPDGSWLAKVGSQYPGAISFWTSLGVRRYLESGLMQWHRRVVKAPLAVLEVRRPEVVLYEDELQVIVPSEIETQAIPSSLENYLLRFSSGKSSKKGYGYILREKEGRLEVLVFDHPLGPVLSPQLPGGTLDRGEDFERAMHREVAEESGLSDLECLGEAGHEIYYQRFAHQMQDRKFFALKAKTNLPETWVYKVQGGGEDDSMLFSYRWMPIEQAEWELVLDQGRYLSGVATSFKKRLTTGS